MEGASVGRRPRDDRRHRTRPDPSSHLPVQGVRREPSGQRPVQRGDEQVGGDGERPGMVLGGGVVPPTRPPPVTRGATGGRD